MKSKAYSLLTSAILASSLQAQTQNYFGTTGTLTDPVWSIAPAGPYTSVLASDAGGSVINFGNTTTAITGASITVAGINATANATFTTTVDGTITNQANGIIPIDVASGITLNFAGQAFTSSASAGYIKNGDGTVALAGGAYGGGFTLNAGTVAVNGVNAMGAGGTLTINGGTLRSSNSVNARDLSGKYPLGITIGANFVLGDAVNFARLTFTDTMALGAASRTITANGAAVISGVMSGDPAVGLTQNGVGALVFTTASNYTGATTINSGTLAFRTPAAKNATTTYTYGPNAALGLGIGTGGFTPANVVAAFQGDLTDPNFAGITIDANTNISIDSTGGAVTLADNIGPSIRGLEKILTGANLTVTGANQYSGRTVVWGGSGFVVNSPGNVGDASSNVGTNSTIDLMNTAFFTVSAPAPVASNRNFNVLGNSIINGNGSATNTITLSGNFSTETAGTKTLDFRTTIVGTHTTSGTISDGSGVLAVAKSNAGTWNLTGNNTFSGGTTVSGGTLNINSPTALGTGPLNTGATIDNTSGGLVTLSNNNSFAVTSNFIFTGTNDLSNGTGNFAINGTRTITVNGGKLTLGGNQTTAIAGGVVKAGVGTLALLGSGIQTGAATISGGTLEAGVITNGGIASSLGATPNTATQLLMSNGTTLRYIGGSNATTDRAFTLNGTADGHGVTIQSSGLGTLSYSGGPALAYGTAAQTRTLTLGGTNTGANIFGKILANNTSGASSLVKSGPGAWTLNQSNTYTGTTAIDGGTLTITGATQATSAITFSGGGVLGLDTATPTVNAASATVDFTGQSVLVTGPTVDPSYTLLTASSITGTPTLATPIPGKTLQVFGGNQLRLVNSGASPYTTWSGGAAANIDTNNDGILNGVAWVVGAANPSATATAQAPTQDNTSDPDFFIFNFRRSDAALADSNTAIKVEYGSTLTGWTPAVAGPDIIITPTNDFYAVGTDKVEVKIRRTLAVNNKLFARLNVVVTP